MIRARVCALHISAATTLLSLCALAHADGKIDQIKPVTDAMLANPDPADWLMWRRTLNNWGYSPLKQVTASNVKQLRLVWTRPLAAGDQEGTPLVHDGILYFPNPNDITQAFDAVDGRVHLGVPAQRAVRRRPVLPGRGHEPQSRDLRQPDSRQRRRRLRVRDRREDRQARLGNADPRLQATARRTARARSSRTARSISGRSCEPEGGPEACVITAFDAKTGKEVWRHRTIPKPGEPGDEIVGQHPVRAALARRHVDGAELRPGRRSASTSARRSPRPRRSSCSPATTTSTCTTTARSRSTSNTGNMIWFFQHVVDNWDLDHPFERLIVDTVVAPDPKSVKWINPSVHRRDDTA